MRSLVIRTVVEADFSAWLPLCKGYQEFYEVSFPDATVATVWSRFFAADASTEAAVAVLDGRLVGYVALIFHGTTWDTRDFCYLEDLYVDPSCRGQRIGEGLIAWAKERAQARDCGRLYWHTQHFNTRARRLSDRVAELAPSRVYINRL